MKAHVFCITLALLFAGGCTFNETSPELAIDAITCTPDQKAIEITGTVAATYDQHLYVSLDDDALAIDLFECGNWERLDGSVPGEVHCARRVDEGSSSIAWRVVYTLDPAEHRVGDLGVHASLTDRNDEVIGVSEVREVSLSPGLPYCNVKRRESLAPQG